jgi:hypothetical protein
MSNTACWHDEILLPVKRIAVQPDEFDKLSSVLASEAAALPPEDAASEFDDRSQVIVAVKKFSHSRHELGRVLFEYRKKWKVEGAWLRVCEAVADTLKVSSRTLFRVIEDYELTLQVPSELLEAMTSLEFDPAGPRNGKLLRRLVESAKVLPELTPEVAKELVQNAMDFVDPRQKHEKLSLSERQLWKLRSALRRALNDVPDDLRIPLLAQAIGEEAFQVWGTQTPFSLKMKPASGIFRLDGCKKPEGAS